MIESSLLPKVKEFFKLNIVASDILITFILLTIFGSIYLVIPKKLSDSTIISPLQKTNKLSIVEGTAKDSSKKEVIGFLPSWIVAQNTDIFIKPLTQLIYFGFNVNENGDIVRYKEDNTLVLEWHYFNSSSFKQLKKEAKENNTKILVAFKLFDNETVDNLISNSVSTNYFIRNAVALLEEYDLDGINLDIEYFTQHQNGAGFTDSDFPTAKFLNAFLTKVVSELKKADPQYLVSVDVNATVILKDKAYDMVKIGEVADQVILMAYDYRMPSSLRAGPVAPINGSINEHSINESVASLVGRVPTEKIILGIPLYGYEWQTVNRQLTKEFTS
ncbi:hypothetical protein HYT32_00485 [Candidatus Roizmanbacteria bacterium]|nr:hypothetical protein [Candidatus Roizmanbacteria bacterium]